MRLSTGETIPTKTVVWTAGVVAHPSVRNLGVPLDERGRVRVDDQLRVEGEQDVWAVGDCAAVSRPGEGRHPPHATDRPARHPPGPHGRPQRGGLTWGRATRARSRYESWARSSTSAATRRSANVMGVTLRGFPAWWLARTYHISQIPGTARKVRAVMDWTVGLPFTRDIAEVGSIGQPRPLSADAYERSGTHRARRLGLRAPPRHPLLLGLATAIVGRVKGSSFFIWFLSASACRSWPGRGAALPRREARARAPAPAAAGSTAYVQVCRVCGEDMYLPDPREVRHPKPG